MHFDPSQYTTEEYSVQGRQIRCRVWRDLPYCSRPADPDFQRLNIFAPEAYWEGAVINGYALDTAPVFMPNTAGGYLSGPRDQPGEDPRRPGQGNSLFQALLHGYIAVSPGLRGRELKTGKAPACIVDYKAAVRFLRHFAPLLPGDENKIVTSGTSAGGALSALMGATGGHPDYEPWLREMGAAEDSDAVFAASCYCPITSLGLADMAYEWQFQGVREFHRSRMVTGEGGRPALTQVDGVLADSQMQVSAELASLFPACLNSLGLTDSSGRPLQLDENGCGSFRDHIEGLVLDSANRALAAGTDLGEKTWLHMENGRAVSMDFEGWVRDITRMKEPPAFDALDAGSFENDLFGGRHFTSYSAARSLTGAPMADRTVIRLLSPMDFLGDPGARTARYWRIRHGERDRDTSLAVSAILALRLEQLGCSVDYLVPWDVPHSGDYDLDELFAWIDRIAGPAAPNTEGGPQ